MRRTALARACAQRPQRQQTLRRRAGAAGRVDRAPARRDPRPRRRERVREVDARQDRRRGDRRGQRLGRDRRAAADAGDPGALATPRRQHRLPGRIADPRAVDRAEHVRRGGAVGATRISHDRAVGGAHAGGERRRGRRSGDTHRGRRPWRPATGRDRRCRERQPGAADARRGDLGARRRRRRPRPAAGGRGGRARRRRPVRHPPPVGGLPGRPAHHGAARRAVARHVPGRRHRPAAPGRADGRHERRRRVPGPPPDSGRHSGRHLGPRARRREPRPVRHRRPPRGDPRRRRRRGQRATRAAACVGARRPPRRIRHDRRRCRALVPRRHRPRPDLPERRPRVGVAPRRPQRAREPRHRGAGEPGPFWRGAARRRGAPRRRVDRALRHPRRQP